MKNSTNNKSLKYNIIFPFLACVSAALFSFYNLFQLSLFNIISPNLLAEFHLTSWQLGIFSSVYLLANTIWLIPGGILLDRYPVRMVALLFITTDFCAALVLATSTWVTLDILARFIQGISSAMSLLISIRLATSWFPSNRATAVASIVAFALLGGVAGNMGFAKLIAFYGWRCALLINGFMGIAVFIGILLFLYEKKEDTTHLNDFSLFKLKNIKTVFLNFSTINYGLFVGLMNLPVFLLATLWGKMYLMDTYQIQAAQASTICGLIFLGIIIGGPITGFMSDRLKKRKLFMTTGALLSLANILILMMNNNLNSSLLAMLFFSLGFFSSSQTIAYAVISETNLTKTVNIATSGVSFMANLVGFLAQPVFGYFLNIKESTSAANFKQAMLIFPIAFISCIILNMLPKRLV